MTYPILYSFRRCPYAIRARLALAYHAIDVELREVFLKDKPAHMLELSPKGSVPVLYTSSQHVVDESLDIMRWAEQHGASGRPSLITHEVDLQEHLIARNDTTFKHWLDRYKYHVRHTEHPREHYQAKVLEILQELDALLEERDFLVCDVPQLADLALFPFVRQCAFSDQKWFFEHPQLPHLQAWLNTWLEHPLFKHIMRKFEPWSPEDEPFIFHMPKS